VGYRVKSPQGTQFRIWATQRLKEYIIKGFALNDERFKTGTSMNYFTELQERIREIRLSERFFYQKIKDIYATSIDYNANDGVKYCQHIYSIKPTFCHNFVFDKNNSHEKIGLQIFNKQIVSVRADYRDYNLCVCFHPDHDAKVSGSGQRENQRYHGRNHLCARVRRNRYNTECWHTM
jgi:hypothetical protein